METSLLVALIIFTFVTSVTPGPNNMMLLASGAQFGFKRSLPHLFGIVIGVALLLSLVLLGLGALFQLYPALYDILKVLGSLYLLWLAWKISSAPTEQGKLQKFTKKAQPLKCWQASLFQFINPKAWAMVIGSVSTFTLAGDLYLQSGLTIMLCFAVMGFIAISIWVWFGVVISKLLTTVKRQRIFNYSMGLLTAATIVMIVNN